MDAIGGARAYCSSTDLYAAGRELLTKASLDDPAGDAIKLLCAAAGCDRATLLARSGAAFPCSVKKTYMSYIARRAEREPIQYIVGEWEFMGLPFVVNRDVLIPRPDTECLVECVVSFIKADLHMRPLILDLCTGSGCVGVSLAFYLRGASIVATDVSARALRVAARNAERNGVSDRIVFIEGDLYQPVDASVDNESVDNESVGSASVGNASAAGALFDVICANPPYIASGDFMTLPDDVRCYEPHVALDGGADGLDFYGRIAEGAAARLRRGGLLAAEVGAGQAGDVSCIFSHNGFSHVRTARDLCGVERVVMAQNDRNGVVDAQRHAVDKQDTP